MTCEGYPQPHWNRDPSFDSLDFGLDLQTEGGLTYGVIWDWDFGNYGLSLRPASIMGQVLTKATWDVTATSRWAGLCGVAITDVNIEWISHADIGGTVTCPQRITISFANGRGVVVTASEGRDGACSDDFADHVSVLFRDRSEEQVDRA